jgi:predicted nucleic acid-binding protein
MKGVLVDTPAWVDHFRKNNESLVSLLTLDLASFHPLIVTELACGMPVARGPVR